MLSGLRPQFLEQVRETKTRIEEQREVQDYIDKMKGSGWRLSYIELKNLDDTRKRTYMTALHTVLADEDSRVARAQRDVESLGQQLKSSFKEVKSMHRDIGGIHESLEDAAISR